jgi:osmotically-inducible protein OsmY
MTKTLHRSDAELKNAVVEELSWLPSVDHNHIGVTADDGAITLTGQVDSYRQKVLAGRAALRVRGVRAVAQEITVHTKWTDLTDTDIAREASEALDRAANVPESVKASVHQHMITLSGIVTWHYQRKAAVGAVHDLKGVTGVIDEVTIRPGLHAVGVKAAIQAAFERNALFEGNYITVTTTPDGRVTLEGIVRSWSERDEAEQVVWSAPGITGITNELRIQ